MEFDLPAEHGFTIYSKSGCIMCTKVKDLLKSNALTYMIVDCDDYLIEERDKFLLFMKELAGKDVRVFPMVFDNGSFVGAYKETFECVEKKMNKLE